MKNLLAIGLLLCFFLGTLSYTFRNADEDMHVGDCVPYSYIAYKDWFGIGHEEALQKSALRCQTDIVQSHGEEVFIWWESRKAYTSLLASLYFFPGRLPFLIINILSMGLIFFVSYRHFGNTKETLLVGLFCFSGLYLDQHLFLFNSDLIAASFLVCCFSLMEKGSLWIVPVSFIGIGFRPETFILYSLMFLFVFRKERYIISLKSVFFISLSLLFYLVLSKGHPGIAPLFEHTYHKSFSFHSFIYQYMVSIFALFTSSVVFPLALVISVFYWTGKRKNTILLLWGIFLCYFLLHNVGLPKATDRFYLWFPYVLLLAVHSLQIQKTANTLDLSQWSRGH